MITYDDDSFHAMRKYSDKLLMLPQTCMDVFIYANFYYVPNTQAGFLSLFLKTVISRPFLQCFHGKGWLIRQH
jgi:hypothetical protein